MLVSNIDVELTVNHTPLFLVNDKCHTVPHGASTHK